MNPFFDLNTSADKSQSSAFLNRSSIGLDEFLECNPTPSRPDSQAAFSSTSIFSIPSHLSLHPPHQRQEQQQQQLPLQQQQPLPQLPQPQHQQKRYQRQASPPAPAAFSANIIVADGRPSFPSGAPSFFGAVATGDRVAHSALWRGTLPHPLTQPYRLYPRPISAHSNQLGVNNFFQSPFPTSSTGTTAQILTATPSATSIDIIVSNVVAVCSVRCHLDLHAVSLKCTNVIFRRDRNVIVMKLRSPHVTCRIWSSGKITCTGGACEEDAKKGCRRVARILSKLGYVIRFTGFRVVNMLASCVFPFAIKLVKFAHDHAKDVDYEPEIHPGACLRFKDLKVNMRVFSTGSVTVTSPKVSNIRDGVLRAYKMVYEYRNEEEDKDIALPRRGIRRAMSIVPLLSQFRMRYSSVVPRGPYHSRYKQQIHREQMLNQALKQVRTAEQTDDFLLNDVYDSDSDFSD